MAVYQLTVRLTHTTGTHVPCSLYAHPEYNDMAHNIPHQPLPASSMVHNKYLVLAMKSAKITLLRGKRRQAEQGRHLCWRSTRRSKNLLDGIPSSLQHHLNMDKWDANATQKQALDSMTSLSKRQWTLAALTREDWLEGWSTCHLKLFVFRRSALHTQYQGSRWSITMLVWGGGYALAAQVRGQWHAKLVDGLTAACAAWLTLLAALSASRRMPIWANYIFRIHRTWPVPCNDMSSTWDKVHVSS